MTKTLTLREDTRDGTPVAKLTPVSTRRVLTPVQQKALAELIEMMDRGYHLGGEKFDRDALYER